MRIQTSLYSTLLCLSWAEKDSGLTSVRIQTSLYWIYSVSTEQNKIVDRLLWGFKPHSIQFCAAWAKQKRIVDRLLWGFKPHFVKFCSRLSWAEKDSGSTLVRMQTSLYSICFVLTEQNKMVDRLRWEFKPHSVQFFSAWAEQKKIVDRLLWGFKSYSIQLFLLSWAE